MQRHTRRTWQTCGGAVLLALSVFGVYYGAKASLAQYAYYRAKYGDARGDVDSIARLCEQAHRLYPHNYRFCAWTAASAWKARGTGDTPERVATADNWCAVGLAVNPLHRPLRLLRARLLQRQAPGEAAAYWARYVEWHFWEPANHAILAELHASAGDVGRAMQSLRWVEGTRYHARALKRIRRAWCDEMRPPAP